ncbi:MAG: zinc-dependent metalloprotease [Bacteroidales bacterium]|nr:zinc-dependent metalloprotease [Bacteroidales bacterium]MDD2425832.1 zinc-dependent metalloprotease [Bacteroidales bacterium]MDD3990118.1 zinc-dependent metalloprotease [Bacteroidales bacterium]MDD4638353.1 zinc-dependent metalloprotease [Bacteroidales bacterium]
MRKLCLLAIVMMSTFGWYGYAKDTPPVKDSASAYDKLFKEKHETARGMFTLHKMKGKVYFEIPLNMMEKDMLIASTLTETSDNANGIVGGKNDPIHIFFTKTGENVQLRRVHTDVITDNQNSGVAKAIERSNIGSIMKSMKIEAYSPDSSAVVVDMTSFFVGDNKDLTPFDRYSQYTMFNGYKRTEAFQQERSFLGNIKAFSDNIVVTSTLSYNFTLTDQRDNKTVVKDAPFTAVVSRSIVLLREKPVRPRFADYRVAIFTTGKQLLAEKEQSSRIIYYANRWNLEPSDVEAFKAGKLVDPVKPIIFYIDNNFPDQWKPHIKEAVEQWNELFANIGFKNAIKAVDFPKDDPEFDPDNIKYSCIRYAPIGIENAMGPSWVDPRSGEIINASVYVYHDIVKLLNNWMFVQISPANPRIRSKKLPDDILNDGIRYVIAHEVGHCLGFMHNMSASSNIPVDSLRSPSFTHTTGTTTSIMDYARFNYVAQPGDMEKGVKLTPPRFGVYDQFTIKWNYSYFPETVSEEQEAETLSKMVSTAIQSPVYRYGKQLSAVLDPRSQTEDLGDDAIKASEYGIKNLKHIMENLNDWVAHEDEDFSYRSEIYDGIVYQYIRYINHVFGNVGGVYLNEVLVKDNMIPFESVEREKQKRSLKFIMDQIDQLDWMENETLMKNLTIMGSARNLIQTVLAKAIIDAPGKVMLSASIAKDPYGFDECSQDVFDFVWRAARERKGLSEIDKFMQTTYLEKIAASAKPMKLVSGVGIEGTGNFSIMDVLGKEDISGRFAGHIKNQKVLEKVPETRDFNPTAGWGVPSTKFNMIFNHESNYYKYLVKAKELIEKARKSGSKEDRLHYELLLKQVNASINVQ